MNSSKASGGVFDLERDKKRLRAIEKKLAEPGAWDQPEKLTPLLQEKTRLSEIVIEWDKLLKAKDDLNEWLTLAREEQTQEVLAELQKQIHVLTAGLQEAELRTLLAAREDNGTALLEIHPGAGGTEAQDWAEMLLRMYVRWAERRDFKVRYLNLLPGDEAGIKSVTLQIEGPYAYGLLKGEAGIHRLIRISPFDASGRRHTSFASVDVYPEAGRDIKIEIKDEDVKIDVFRSSGPGGQSVNKTSSAVRLTHIPTDITVQCQNEKSQLRNKETAFKILKARLYDLELSKIEAEKKAQYADKDAIAWGSQIRTYTLQPYRLVKDHRGNMEISDVDAVLDGDLDALIRNQLLYAYAQKNNSPAR